MPDLLIPRIPAPQPAPSTGSLKIACDAHAAFAFVACHLHILHALFTSWRLTSLAPALAGLPSISTIPLVARTALAALAIAALGIAARFNKSVEHFRPAPLEVAVLLETAL